VYIKSANDEQHYESSGLLAPRILSPDRELTSIKNLNKSWECKNHMYTIWNNWLFTNYIHHIASHFWLLQKVCGILDHCFITTHIIHNEGDTLQIYFCVIFRKTRNHAQPLVTSGTHINCTLSLAAGRTPMAAKVCWRFRWPVFVMVTLESQNICCGRTWSSNQSGGGAILLFPASSIKFLTRRSLKSRWVYSYLAPHEDNSIQLLSTVRPRKWKNNFMVHLKVRWHIK